MNEKTSPVSKADRNAYYREYRQANKDKIREYQKRYRERHKELCAERIYKWRENNPEKAKAIAKRCYEKQRDIITEKRRLIYKLGTEALAKMEAENGN